MSETKFLKAVWTGALVSATMYVPDVVMRLVRELAPKIWAEPKEYRALDYPEWVWDEARAIGLVQWHPMYDSVGVTRLARAMIHGIGGDDNAHCYFSESPLVRHGCITCGKVMWLHEGQPAPRHFGLEPGCECLGVVCKSALAKARGGDSPC